MLCFTNPGILPHEAISTFGASVKSENAIGYFGTGLKYALAVLLREGQKIEIMSGGKRYNFDTKKTLIKEKEFQLVTMNKKPIGFTTELGKNWLMWMAFRELFCNALDEGGTCDIIQTKLDKKDELPENTYIYVTGKAMEEEYYRRDENFLSSKPIMVHRNVEIHEGRGSHIYYRGVRVHTLPQQSIYRYNLTSKMSLTEDRTLMYTFMAGQEVAACLSSLENEEILERILSCSEADWEKDLSFYTTHASDKFVEVATRLYKNNPDRINSSAIDVIRSVTPDKIFVTAELNKIQSLQMQLALNLCDDLGYRLDGIQVMIVETLGPIVMAIAKPKGRLIIISKQCFDQGTKFLASTLLEEIIHIREGLCDETRAMQTYLFNKIISLGEQLRGEPI